MEYFIGLDFGTQGVRCGVADAKGEIIIANEVKYNTLYPEPGRATQKPEDWLLSAKQAMDACRSAAGQEIFERVRGMSLCTTASTVIPVDEAGQPLTDAILWMDVRAWAQSRQINATKHEVLKHCGMDASVEWLVPKMLWIKQNQPDIFNNAHKIVEQQDFINHYLTGRWCASVCQATGKAHYVEALGGFVPGFFEAIGLPEFFQKGNTDVLLEGDMVGTLRREISEHYGLPAGLPVYQGGVDAHMGMIGLGVCKPGDTGQVMGSSFAQFAISKDPVFKGGIWGPYKDAIIPGLYALEGGQISAGSITKWFVKEFHVTGENPYMEIAYEAEKIKRGSEGIVALDFFQGNRTPFKDPMAKGVFYGMTLSHTRAHLYRAVLESVAFGTRNILDSMGVEINAVRGCGGVVNNPVWLQIIADVSGRPIVLTKQSGNAGVLGCAIIAAAGSGQYADFQEACGAMVQTERIVEPDALAKEAYEPVYQKYLELYDRLKDLMHN